MNVNDPYGIHWFRRDLRVAGNPALEWSWREHRGRVLGFFCFDRVFLSRPDFSPDRFGFFLETLSTLQAELRAAGGDLLVLDVGPDQAFPELFSKLEAGQHPLPKTLSFNRDYEPFARARDQRMAKLLEVQYGISIHSERDHLLIEPHELLKSDKSYYQVFTPFSKRWFELLGSSTVQDRIRAQGKGLKYLKRKNRTEPIFQLTWEALFCGPCPFPDHLQQYREKNRNELRVPLPKAGSIEGLACLKCFQEDALKEYAHDRDRPDLRGTSGMSIYLKNGSITSAQIIAELGLEEVRFGEKSGAAVYLKEIVWREFYYHILYHVPRVEHESFNERYKEIPWKNREDWFEAWKQGMTGYPIVDAGMRQLNTTGWMHNRVRMIVASFLTKDLHINWQWGERYFMERLLDGDLAPNNGGWQWAASTGCDPQPYFRIFNPLLQSEKFDPEGDYIRRYVDELREVKGKAIHDPHTRGATVDYPVRVVDHAAQRDEALEMYGKD